MNVLQFHYHLLWKKITFKLRKGEQTWLRKLKPKMDEEIVKYQDAVRQVQVSKLRKMASHSTKGTFSCEPGTTLAISVKSSTGSMPERL